MAALLRAITSSSSSTGDSMNPVNDIGKRVGKWALVIGVPTAVCVAAYLVYRQQQDDAKKSTIRRSSFISLTSTTVPVDVKLTSDNKIKVLSIKRFRMQIKDIFGILSFRIV